MTEKIYNWCEFAFPYKSEFCKMNASILFFNLGEYTFTVNMPWTRTSDTVITISLGGDGRITNGSFEVRIYS